MTDETPERPLKVGDLVGPIGVENATPRYIRSIETEYGGDIPQPLPEPVYVLDMGIRCLARELVLVEAAHDHDTDQENT